MGVRLHRSSIAARIFNIIFLTKLTNIVLWSLAGILTFSTILLIVKSWDWPLIWDAARVHYVCWRILEGCAPYRDIFDVDFPGTYFFQLFVMKVLGKGNLGWRIFDISCLIVINIFIIIYCRPYGKLPSLLGAALFSSFHLYNGPLYAGQRDYYMTTFIIAGIYLAARYFENNLNLYFLSSSGLVLGAAPTIKPHAGIYLLFVLFLILVFSYRSGYRWWAHGILFVICASVFPGVIFFWLWSIGGLDSFFEIVFKYLIPFYSQFKYHSISYALFQRFLKVPLIFEILIICGLGIVDLIIQEKVQIRRLLLIGGVLCGFILYVAQGRNDYQLYPAILFLFLCAVSLIDTLRIKYSPRIYILTLAVVLHLSIGFGYRSIKSFIAEPPHHFKGFQCTEDLILDLQGRVSPSENVQVIDFMSGAIQALYTLHYRQATKFIYDFHFFHNSAHPYIKKLREEFLTELKQKPPIFIIVAKNSWPASGYERLQDFPELVEWIHSNYFLETERECYRLYKKSNK